MVNLNNKNNKIYWYIIILISLFILVLFTRIQFNNIQVSLDEKSTSESRYQIARNEVDRLNEIEKKLNSSEVDVSKYINEIKEDDIIDYIYGNIEDYNLDIASTGEIIVRSMSLKEGKVNEIWFNELDIVLNLRVSNEERMYKALDFFVSEDSKYKFFIESFSYTNVGQDSGFNITIPLKIFYK